ELHRRHRAAGAALLNAERSRQARGRAGQVRQTEHGLNAATDAARLEVESSFTAFGAADEVVTTQQKALELARESVTIAQTPYENGVITSAELSDAQVRLLQTEWR
nr:TolC family protein [Acidobacteriota bacterium]